SRVPWRSMSPSSGRVRVMTVGGEAFAVVFFLSDIVDDLSFLNRTIHAAESGSVDTQDGAEIGQPERAVPSVAAPAANDRIEEEVRARRVTRMTTGTQRGNPFPIRLRS